MDTAGAVIGPLIALGALTLLDDDLRQVLWLAVIPAVASALLVLLIREPARAPVTATAPRPRSADLVARAPAPPRAPLVR